MKVAVYSGNIPSTTFIENLIEGLAQSGTEILLFGKQTAEVKYKGNVKVYPTPASGAGLFINVMYQSLTLLAKDPGLLIKCYKILKNKKKKLKGIIKEAGIIFPILNNKPDIFHIQWAKTVEQHPELFELLNSKFIVSLRGAHINYSPILDFNLAEAYRKYFPGIDGFHAVSEHIGREAMKYGAEKNKIKVIHSSIKDELFLKKSELYKSGNTLEIISIGRFHWKKGYHYALDAMKILNDSKIDFTYSIIAQGKIPEEITFMINEYGLSDKVNIIPGMKHDELIKKLQTSHLLILPSVEEGIANVVLEAMATGVPVLTTDCGGMDEVVVDKVNGYIVPVRDPVLLSDKIKQFINSDIEFKTEIVKKAKNTIKEDFSIDKQMREFSGLYNTILGS
ncbi:MAG TPA: glycosyltransferase family 4 protein [Ignavibacteria bacterium]|mgnify:CR=1 FL=1|nr:glycosyltransferase family 4 protein [Ignavibacteria bacterium]